MLLEEAALESSGGAFYSMNIGPDDIEISDTVTAVWNIEQGE